MTFDRIYLLPERMGDQLAVLPLLRADAHSGLNVAMLVHTSCSGLLDGVSYAKEIVFDGAANDIAGQVTLAKSMSNDVRYALPGGSTETLASFGFDRQYTDSFVKEMYHHCGRLDDWQKQLPLVFDRRSPEREKALMQSLRPGKGPPRKRKYVLVSVDGITSPFPYKPLIFELLRGRCMTELEFTSTVIDLSKIKAERMYDFLGLYEESICLIACDSAHLHLAHARPTLPVIALLQDKPTYWYGSAWRPSHICSIRYGDFASRAVEMLDAIERLKRPGSILPTTVRGPKLIHVYNAVELNGEHAKARETWEREYLSARWIETPIQLGAAGRDARTELKDDKPFPILKDAIRMASMRAKDNDLIVLTKPHTCFTEGLTERLTNGNPWFAHRMLNDTFHPACDLLAFSKDWWVNNRAKVPDFILGRDEYWSYALMEIVKRNGGKELEAAIYRQEKK